MPDTPGGANGHRPDVAAVINTSPDCVDMLRQVLESTGIVTVTAFTWEVRDGHVDVDAFMSQHRPGVIVYDIAPPYDRNWNLFLHFRELPAVAGTQFVITSTNADYVGRLATGEMIYEVIGKPYDLDLIVRGVKEALRARPTR